MSRKTAPDGIKAVPALSASHRKSLSASGASLRDLLGHVGVLLGEVVGEHLSQLLRGFVVGGLVRPRCLWGFMISAGNAGAALGNVHVEGLVVGGGGRVVLHIVKGAV